MEHKNIEHIILYNINTEFYHINIIFNNNKKKIEYKYLIISHKCIFSNFATFHTP